MKRYPVLSLIILAAFIGTNCRKLRKTEKKSFKTTNNPNIVILFTDDMGYGGLQSYGNPTIKTPNIDHLADGGIRFTAYEASHWCVPSRTELLTGRYFPRVKFGGKTGADGKGGLPDSELTLAEGLKQAGYATGMAGKWHLGYKKNKFLPPNQGFDSWLGLPYSNDYKKPYLKTNEPLVMYRDTTAVEYPVNQDSLTVKYTDEAVRYIRQHSNDDQSFFFYLAYNMPHLPIHTTRDFFGTSGAGLYGDVVETIDWSVGRILQTLDDQNIADNTIIFFASDNGPWQHAPARMFKVPKEPEGTNWDIRGAGNKHWYVGSAGPLTGYKSTIWEGETRVPAMIRWPGHIKPHQVSDAIICNLDIYRTFLEAAGSRLPDNKIDGYNFMPYLTGKTDKAPRNTFSYFYHGQLQAMRVGEWKLKLNKKKPMLFNLQSDPGEHYNRAKKHPEMVQSIRDRMVSFANAMGMTVPTNDK